MQGSILSLKHMCCQVFAVIFWQKQATRRLQWEEWHRECQVYKNYKSSIALKEWIASLEVPKSLDEELHMVTMAFGQTLRTVTEFHDLSVFNHLTDFITVHRHTYDGLLALPQFYDSISLSSSGGINIDGTFGQLLLDNSITTGKKYYLAKNYCVYDSNISDNLEDYCRKLNGSHQVQWTRDSSEYPQSCLKFLKEKHVLAATYYWSKMSPEDKAMMSQRIDEIAASLSFRSVNLRKTHKHYPVFKFLTDRVSLQNGQDLISRFYYEPFRQVFTNIVQEYFDYYANPLYSPADDFLVLLEKSFLPEEAFYMVIEALVSSIIMQNKPFLFPSLLSLWDRRSDVFKANFKYQDYKIKSFLFLYSRCNIEYAYHIFMLLRAYDPSIESSLSPRWMAQAIINLYRRKKPFGLLDKFLKRFGDPSEDVATLKKNAFESDIGCNVIRNYLNTEEGRHHAYAILIWAFGTELEADKHFRSFRNNAPLASLIE